MVVIVYKLKSGRRAWFTVPVLGLNGLQAQGGFREDVAVLNEKGRSLLHTDHS